MSVRCPYCGDSRKSKMSAHLYIKMEPPFLMYCQRCSTSGTLNNSTLRDLDLYDKDISVALASGSKIRKKSSYIQVTELKTKVHIPESSVMVENNVNYINSRFNTNYDIDTLVNEFKVILDPFDFFQKNYISKRVYENRGFDFTQAVGFLSSDKSHVIFRDTSGTQQKRYFNAKLYPKDEDNISNKIYNISTNIDVMEPYVNLIITEGIFDIIGVKNALYKNPKNTIFAASCGKGFNAVISHYIKLGFLDLNITIYSDDDVDIDFYKQLKETSPYLDRSSRITVYYNRLGKDFGVPKEKIQVKKAII